MATRPRLTATRRSVLRGAPALAGLWAAGAHAAADLKGKTVVFASWGGAYQDAERACYCDPFAAATGARVVQDGPMNIAKFRAMVEGGTPDWDVADVTIDFLYAGSADRMFEPIDKAAVDTGRIDPRFVHENGVGCIVWSNNLAYRVLRRQGAAQLGRPVRREAFPRQADAWGRADNAVGDRPAG